MAFAFDMAQLVHEVTKVLDEPLAHKQAVITLSALAPPSMIQADRDQFKQVLLNVMQNAIEATPTGGAITVTLTQLARGVEPGLEVAVTDHGQGISPAHLQHVFEPFFTSGKPRGTGLGLAICRNILDAHGGTSHWTVSRGAAPRFACGRRYANSRNECKKKEPMQATIYVTDDEPAIRSAIVKRLSAPSHRHRTPNPVRNWSGLSRNIPDLILLDLKMPGMGGIEALRQIRPLAPQTLVIMLTAYGTVENAVEAMRLGAYDFLIKSVDLSGVDPVVDRALEFLALRHRVEFAMEDQNSAYALSNIEVRSPAMQLLLGQVRDVAQNAKATVLLQGETGSGKEFLASRHPPNGPRATGPFVAVNCTAIPKELFESELFGYERGAFTGAHQRKRGLLEKAEGGTLFLDEIGDLDPAMQAKLLRVLQERTFRRLGGTEDLSVDFRLMMTATNRDLKKTPRGDLSRRSLLPSERGDLRTPVVARPNGGHPPALHAGDVAVRQNSAKKSSTLNQRRRNCSSDTAILEISANCRTSSSAP